jgi:hypothetical protein
MESEDLSTWEDFESRLKTLTSTPTQLGEDVPRGYSSFLFRGQESHCWQLTTTLERYVPKRMSMKRYYKTIHVAKPQIETFTGARWSILTPPKYEKWLAKHDMFVSAGNFPGAEYMIYLRHHGFPSPLLDWTRSPYVAAYFAFSGTSEAGERVAIFAFREHAGKGKVFTKEMPHIEILGSNIRSHRRHFLQQSEYSICLVYEADTWFFTNHELVCGDEQSEQDILWKFTLPISERLKVLRMLDGFNLNSFSLFASEEALMETMALRELAFRGTNR